MNVRIPRTSTELERAEAFRKHWERRARRSHKALLEIWIALSANDKDAALAIAEQVLDE